MTELKGRRLVTNPIVVLREERDEWAVLFNPDTADAVGLNPVGVAVWKLVDAARDVDAIVAELRARFDEVPAHAPDEVRAYLDGLVERGFIGLETDWGEGG